MAPVALRSRLQTGRSSGPVDYRPHRSARPTTVSEHGGDYRSASTLQPAERVRMWMDEMAELADQRDRTMARWVRLLASTLAHDDLDEVTGGVSLHVWLQHRARCTNGEARDLVAAARTLRVMPRTLGGLADGWLSWPQALSIAKAARKVRVADRSDLDALVGGAMLTHRDWEPGALVEDVWGWVDERRPSRLEQVEDARQRARFVTLTPGDEGGGTIFGELDAIGFASVVEALDGPLGWVSRGHGQALADRLVEVCQQSSAGQASSGRPARPLVLATVPLDGLLDARRVPGFLLHTLTGGRMRVSSRTLQRLVDERGADLRTVVLDDLGQVVGVGNRSYVAPGWLREAIWASELGVRDPDGLTAVRRADLDHIDPWPGGTTDAGQLQPIGRPWHLRKTHGPWSVTRARDGTTSWRHRRHDWTITLAPPRRRLADPPRLPL